MAQQISGTCHVTAIMTTAQAQPTNVHVVLQYLLSWPCRDQWLLQCGCVIRRHSLGAAQMSHRHVSCQDICFAKLSVGTNFLLRTLV